MVVTRGKEGCSTAIGVWQVNIATPQIVFDIFASWMRIADVWMMDNQAIKRLRNLIRNVKERQRLLLIIQNYRGE
jgi:hypothetical protein